MISISFLGRMGFLPKNWIVYMKSDRLQMPQGIQTTFWSGKVCCFKLDRVVHKCIVLNQNLQKIVDPKITLISEILGRKPFLKDISLQILVVNPNSLHKHTISLFSLLCNYWFFFSFQGYTHPREYIVTEWPLPNTCSDIWSLVYDHDCSAVVVLCNPTSTVANVRLMFPMYFNRNSL